MTSTRPVLRLQRAALQAHRRLIEATCPHAHEVFFDTRDFPWIGPLETHWQTIRDDALRLLARRSELPAFADVSPRQAGISGRGWRTFFFRVYGHDVPESAAACPATARLLAELPQLRTAMFSVLEAGQDIPPHRGPFKGVLRLHIPLVVPADASQCAIEVGGRRHHWEAGRAVVFDDTFVHRAWNATDQDRVVLFADFARPLPVLVGVVNTLIMEGLRWLSPDVRKAAANARRFSAAIAAAQG
jgi:aspartyl/asparaginyl beta-hydroxylase (cupin superfamily)